MGDSEWSVPKSAIYAQACELLDADEQAVLATVIDVEGNAYRRPGAKMLIIPDGDGVGSVTAGCLEDDIRQLAEDILATGESHVETYDLMEDNDVWGLGVGCNGIIDVLLEPLTEEYRPALDAFTAGTSFGLTTVIDGDAPKGAKAYYQPEDGFTDESNAPAWLQSTIGAEVQACLDRERSQVVNVETKAKSATVFVDAFTPPPKLVVGSGHDVSPVVELATNVDFRTHVVGYRGTTATADQFLAADTVRSTSPVKLRNVETFDKNTYVVVMTHNFVDDRLTLEALLETPVPYIGIMGPRERFEKLLDTMDGDETTPTPTDADFNRIYTPVGLDLGSGTPYGIAHSIVAEVLSVANDRDPGHLSAREGSIHERIEAE